MDIIQAKSFSVDEYHKLTEIGFFHEDDHIQLDDKMDSLIQLLC